MTILALTHHTGIRLAEIGFVLVIVAGAALIAAQIPQFKIGRTSTIVAGVALVIAGVLLVIATHWGGFA
jgi:hypothetical protein